VGRFFDRYLPAPERRTALWLALGGAALGAASQFVGSAAYRSAMASAGTSTAVLVAAGVRFAVVALLVALLVRFARAPKALAFYLVVGAVVSVLLSAVGLPFDYLSAKAWQASVPQDAGGLETWWISSAQATLGEVAEGLGALAGAWIAATVSLARIRDKGFSGDDPEGQGLRSRPGAIGWGFLGWEGRPLSGDSLIAVAFVAMRALTGLLPVALSGVLALVSDRFGGGIAPRTLEVLYATAAALWWLIAAWVVTRRSGVVSLWVLPAAGLLQGLWFAVRSDLLMRQGPVPADMLASAAMSVLTPVVVLVAVLAGTELGLKTRPATLTDRPDPQDPGAGPPAPDDTAGGTDG